MIRRCACSRSCFQTEVGNYNAKVKNTADNGGINQLQQIECKGESLESIKKDELRQII